MYPYLTVRVVSGPLGLIFCTLFVPRLILLLSRGSEVVEFFHDGARQFTMTHIISSLIVHHKPLIIESLCLQVNSESRKSAIGAARNSFRRKQQLVTAARGAPSTPTRTESDGNESLRQKRRSGSTQKISQQNYLYMAT